METLPMITSSSLTASFMRISLSTLLFLAASPSVGLCEELKDVLGRVQKFADEKNFPKAIDELNWAQKELQKGHSIQLERFFPNDIKGFKGDKIKANAALGFSQVERSYTSDEKNITVSLTGGSSAGGLGNLAQLGKFAAMMGSESGQEVVRIKGRTAQLEGDEESSYSLSIFLESGGVLKLDASSDVTADQLKEFAESLMLEELDKYLKG
jgi:hypothetical protein